MNDRNLVRGVLLMGISLAFGLPALRYRIGDFSRAGPGLFPLMIASLLLLVGIGTVVRSRFVARVHLEFNIRNITIILGSLCAFAVVSEFVNMIAGIVVLVFIASIAASSYSVVRNFKIAVGLVLIALAFQKLSRR